MPKNESRIGGFAAFNSGEMTNCYSLVRIHAKKGLIGGFVGENTSDIAKSFSCVKLKKLTGGFSGADTGKTEDSCYFFHDEKEGSKKLTRLRDPAKGQRSKEIKKDEDLENLGFDIETIWKLGGEKTLLQFNPDNWFFDTEEQQTDPSQAEEAITIKNADELFELARKINEGDRELAKAHFILAEDIDLGGREWIPIGRERTRAFTGVFDGKGYTIRNFVMKDKKVENKGFFGFLKGYVYNLTVDCNIKGGTYAGGIAAQNEGGFICFCGSIVEIWNKNGNAGGLVGRNAGTIVESYAAGRIKVLFIPWYWGLYSGLPLLLSLLLPLLFFIPENPFNLAVFAPVPYDADAVPVNDGLTPNGEGNFVSFQFEQNIDVSRTTGTCTFNFVNPGNSNHDIVVQLHFTDAQANRVMGSTGRSAEEQQLIESAEGYDAENYRTVIAQSGAIRPGYGLTDLRLTTHENGATVPPGDYNAMVYLIFYDIGTHNRAMLESQLPVVISVHD